MSEPIQAASDARCRCAEAPEAWCVCPLPQHDHARWTEHGWNCPASCTHPDALRAHETGRTRVEGLGRDGDGPQSWLVLNLAALRPANDSTGAGEKHA